MNTKKRGVKYMANLQLEVTHSLTFLSNLLSDINKVLDSTSTIVKEISTVDLDKDGAKNKMRKDINDYRDDADDDIEFMMDDFKLFQQEMSDIVKNKDTDTVIYSLRRYRELYNKYKDLQKDLKSLNRKAENRSDDCVKEKDYIRYILLNKTTVPIYRLLQIVDSCIYALEHIIDEEDKKKRA